MTQHRDSRTIVHPPRPVQPRPARPAWPVPRLLVAGTGDGVSSPPTRPR